MNRTLKTIIAAAAVLFVSCGGSSNTQLTGIQGSGVAYGPITGFGSIFVNGVEYTTTSAQIRIDDQSSSEAQLHVGQIVTVKGAVNPDGKTGTAIQVTFNGDVAGAVVQVNAAAGTFIVLGQTVLVTGSTMFDENIQPAGIAGLQAGTLVEVSGFPNAAGQIVASRVQLEPAGKEFKARGVVQTLDTAARTFHLNTLVVDYSAVTPSGTLANGSIVKVKGAGITTTGALLASSVEVTQGFGAAAAAPAEVEGIITSFTSNMDFVLNGQHVTAGANTQFVLNGVTLGVNVRVEVQGSFDSTGTLVATSVEAKADSSSLVRGLVSSVPANNALSVLGTTVTTNATTEFQDDSSLKQRPVRFSDLRTGDYIEARGTAAQTGGLLAKVVVRQPPAALSYLQGTASNLGFNTLTVLGVTVTTTTQTQFSGADGATLTAGAFFAQAANKTVKVGGTVSGGAFIATQAQIKP
jgi:hypothetical protein